MADDKNLQERAARAMAVLDDYLRPVEKAFLSADGDLERQSEILSSVLGLAVAMTERLGVRIEKVIADWRGACCPLCKGHRWLRVQGPAAGVLVDRPGAQEARGPCMQCNMHQECTEPPDDWDQVPIVRPDVHMVDADPSKVGQA